jgi:hypothetical protein
MAGFGGGRHLSSKSDRQQSVSSGRSRGAGEGQQMAASTQKESRRDGPLRETLQTLVAPDSKRSAPAEEYILGSKPELPAAYGHGHAKWVADGDRSR